MQGEELKEDGSTSRQEKDAIARMQCIVFLILNYESYHKTRKTHTGEIKSFLESGL